MNSKNRSSLRGVELLEVRRLLAVTVPDWFTINGSVESYEVTAVVSHDAAVALPKHELQFAGPFQLAPASLPIAQQLIDTSGSQSILFGDLVPMAVGNFFGDYFGQSQEQTQYVTPFSASVVTSTVYELRADSIDSPYAGRLKIGVVPMDADRLTILPIHVRRFAGANDTRLLQPITPGDTSIVVADASGWSNSFAAPAQTRSLAWYGYVDSQGGSYADYTYTRNTLGSKGEGAWASGGISVDVATGGHRIVLSRPWSGPVVAAGTAIRNAVADDGPFQLATNIYGSEKNAVSSEQVRHYQTIQVQALIGGQPWDSESIAQSALPIGTKSIVIASSMQLNHLSIAVAGKSSEPATFSGMQRIVADVSLQSFTADLAQPIDVGQASFLGVTASVKTTVSQARPIETHSLGYEAVDIDGKIISSAHVVRHRSAVDTTLAATLQPGDTQIVLSNSAGWSTHADPATRTLAWYGFKNSRGETYADYTYTRNVASDSIVGLWSTGGVVGNTITLNKPWAGPTLQAGTAVRNAVVGSAIQPVIIAKSPLPAALTRLSSSAISGVWQNGIASTSSFPPGTHAIRPAASFNETDFARDDIVVLESFTVTSTPTRMVMATPTVRKHVLLLDVLANDPVVLSRPQVTLTNISSPSFGSAVIVSGKVQYTGVANFIGVDRFSYTLSDPISGETWTEQISVAITGGNHDQDPTLVQGLAALQAIVPRRFSPIALDDSNAEQLRESHYRVTSGTVLVVDGVTQTALRNNDDYGGLPATNGTVYGLVDAPRHGSMQMNPNGTFTYVPKTGYHGTDSFRYFRFDGLRLDTAIARIEVFKNEREFVSDSIGLLLRAMLNHHAAYNQFPIDRVAAADPAQEGVPRLSWRVHVLPFLGFHELYAQFRLNEPWDSPHNLPLSAKMPNIFGDGMTMGAGNTRIQALTGPALTGGAVLKGPVGLRNDGQATYLRDVLDGTSNSILLVQTSSDRSVPWTAPREAEFNYANPLDTVGPIDPLGILVGMFSGDVHSLPANVSSETFETLATRAGFSSAPIVDIGAIQRTADPQAWDAGGLRQDRNFESLGLGLLNFQGVYGSLPPRSGVPREADGTHRFSWRVYLLPFIDQQDLWEKFKTDEPWDSPHNLALLPLMPDIFRSTGDSVDSQTTRIQMVQGPGTAHHVDANGLVQASRPSDVVDGPSNTLMVVETGPDRRVLWTQPDEFDFDPANPLANLGVLSAGFFRALKADGDLVKLPSNISPDSLAALLTRDSSTYYGTGVIPTAESMPLDSLLRQYDSLNPVVNEVAQLKKLEHVGLAYHNYHETFRQLPIVNRDEYFDSDGKPFLSWRVHLLPSLGYQALFNQFRLNEPWNSPHNLPLMQYMPDVFRDSDSPWDSTTTRIQQFVDGGTPSLNHRDGALFRSVRQTLSFRNVSDGLSNTLFAVQSGADVAVPWTQPADISFDRTKPFRNLGQIDDGFLALRGDGAAFWYETGPDERLAAWVTGREGIPVPTSLLQSTISKDVIAEGEDFLTIETTMFYQDPLNPSFPSTPETFEVINSDPTVLEVSPTQITLNANNRMLPHRITVRAIANGIMDGSRTATITIAGQSFEVTVVDQEATAQIAGRQLFYHNATGANLSSEGDASGAIDPSKAALQTPGATATFSNYSNYSRGLNGLIIDIDGLPSGTTDAQMLESLQFASWNGIVPAGFAPLPVAAQPTVTVLRGSGTGGSTRVKITFPDNSLQNTWLRTTVLANAQTGLAANDVFYFGNVIGDLNVGNTSTRLRVNGQDTQRMLSNQSPGDNTASATNIYDLNRDGRVDGQDINIILANQKAGGIVAPITVPPILANALSTPLAKVNELGRMVNLVVSSDRATQNKLLSVNQIVAPVVPASTKKPTSLTDPRILPSGGRVADVSSNADVEHRVKNKGRLPLRESSDSSFFRRANEDIQKSHVAKQPKDDQSNLKNLDLFFARL